MQPTFRVSISTSRWPPNCTDSCGLYYTREDQCANSASRMRACRSFLLSLVQMRMFNCTLHRDGRRTTENESTAYFLYNNWLQCLSRFQLKFRNLELRANCSWVTVASFRFSVQYSTVPALSIYQVVLKLLKTDDCGRLKTNKRDDRRHFYSLFCNPTPYIQFSFPFVASSTQLFYYILYSFCFCESPLRLGLFRIYDRNTRYIAELGTHRNTQLIDNFSSEEVNTLQWDCYRLLEQHVNRSKRTPPLKCLVTNHSRRRCGGRYDPKNVIECKIK